MKKITIKQQQDERKPASQFSPATGEPIRCGHWWRKKSSGLPYSVDMVSEGRVYLRNEAGSPDGDFAVDDFRKTFYRMNPQN